MKHYALVTLFPEMTDALTQYGISGRAFRQGLCQLDCVNPRNFASDKHKTVDDKPYGGGPGMVMAYPPLAKALTEATKSVEAKVVAATDSTDRGRKPPKVLYLSPQGRQLTHDAVVELAKEPGLVLLSGRYEGIDERVIEEFVDDEISIGDFVVSGGELPAMLLLDAIIRLLPGALGDSESAKQDSFTGRGMLDYPHYTRPETVTVVEGKSNPKAVPDVLLSGDHEKIAQWRLKQALFRTRDRRPDLMEQLVDNDLLSSDEKHWLDKM